MANTMTITNQSPAQKPLKLYYKIARKNPHHATVYGSKLGPVTITDSYTVHAGLDGYKYVGVVPVKINGKAIPPVARVFAMPRKCALATDARHRSGTLGINLTINSNSHGTLKCSVGNGSFG